MRAHLVGRESAPAAGSRHRPVRSYVRREGRMTTGQRRALARGWKSYGIEVSDARCDLDRIFERRAPRTLEIGFGMGDSLAAMAEAHPERDYLGIEVYRPGVGHLLARLESGAIANVRIIAGDAAQVLGKMIADAAFAEVYLLFPDPWPKKRHHKRRLIQPGFVTELARVLEDGGRLFMATDWQDYAKHMLAVMASAREFVNVAGPDRFGVRPEWRAVTKFETRGARQGRAIFDLQFSRKARTASSPE
jgi:tRNA (guanine-N7-)-methyltransferase